MERIIIKIIDNPSDLINENIIRNIAAIAYNIEVITIILLKPLDLIKYVFFLPDLNELFINYPPPPIFNNKLFAFLYYNIYLLYILLSNYNNYNVILLTLFL